MSMKKSDLAKNLGQKIEGQMKGVPPKGRYAQASGESVDRREQRRLDAAAGLVPFACKLQGELLKKLNERAATHEGGINALVGELLEKGLKG
jgi:hypothetical protein